MPWEDGLPDTGEDGPFESDSDGGGHLGMSMEDVDPM